MHIPRRFFTALLSITSALLIVGFVNALYPYVGFDYKYFLPRLFDTYLHYRVNGFSIQWYTPSFGGGLPAYANPQHMQFSLPQLLTTFTAPWNAALASIFIYAMAGFWGTYTVCRRIYHLGWTSSALGAVFFTINGFYLEHMAIGHLGFQAFPLLPCFLLFLMLPSLPDLAAGALVGLLLAALIYSGGFYPTVYIALATGMLLPITYLISPELFSARRFITRLVWSTAFGLALSASKIYAVLSFMRFFPRILSDSFSTGTLQAFLGMLAQLAGTMTLGPYYLLTGQKLATVRNFLQDINGSGAGIWELDNSLSPVLLVLVLTGAAGAVLKIIRKGRDFWSKRTGVWAATLLLIFAIELTIEFCLARGFFYPGLSQLPILRSLHVNTRYSSAFILPLALVGALVFENLRAWMKNRDVGIFAGLVILVYLFAAIYFISPMDVLQRRLHYTPGITELYENTRKTGEIYPVEQIVDKLNDPRVFDQNASNMNPYEVLFGYKIGKLKLELVPGPVWDVRDGRFNMTNPTGYVYPEENDSIVFERILASQADTLRDFINRRQPAAWKVPFIQIALNGLGIFGFLSEIVILGWLAWKSIKAPLKA
jgi:hypothetical protein